MVNVNKLKGRIVENNSSVEKLSEKIDMNKSTFYRKLNNENGNSFTILEATLISKELNLTMDEVNEIFFGQYVACDAN